MHRRLALAYDETLDARILSATDGWRHVSTKKMFGGVCHLIHGNMFGGVYKDFLILRLGEAAAAEPCPKRRPAPSTLRGDP
jgi:TfoX/Sxy family transcriptional regulator of competence genes